MTVCWGNGDGARYGVGRAKESFNVALSLHFVSLTIQHPARPISWAPEVAVILCRRCWGLPLSEKVVLFNMPFSHRRRKSAGIQFKKSGSKCHYCVLFLCWCKHAEMMFGFLCCWWGQLWVGLWPVSFINSVYWWAYRLPACLISFPSRTVFSPSLKTNNFFTLSPQEQHPNISRYGIATKLNTVVDFINSLVNVGLFQATPMIWHIAVMKQKFIGTHFTAAAAFFCGPNAPWVCTSVTT